MLMEMSVLLETLVIVVQKNFVDKVVLQMVVVVKIVVDGCGGCCGKNDGGGGGDSGGETLLLLLLFSNSCLPFNLFNMSLITKSVSGGPEAFFISSLAISFFLISSSLLKN